MKIPYGIADFYALRAEEYLYVDRTDRIGVIEDLGKNLLFLRPRRFGKSLWMRTLACYYDLRYASEHDRLFAGLAIGKDATPLAHRYFVLDWDFSDLDPDPPPLGRGSRAPPLTPPSSPSCAAERSSRFWTSSRRPSSRPLLTATRSGPTS